MRSGRAMRERYAGKGQKTRPDPILFDPILLEIHANPFDIILGSDPGQIGHPCPIHSFGIALS